jgi:hypothetical protein
MFFTDAIRPDELPGLFSCCCCCPLLLLATLLAPTLAADCWLLIEPALLAVRLPAKLAALLPTLLLELLLVGSLNPAASRASAMPASAAA